MSPWLKCESSVLWSIYQAVGQSTSVQMVQNRYWKLGILSPTYLLGKLQLSTKTWCVPQHLHNNNCPWLQPVQQCASRSTTTPVLVTMHWKANTFLLFRKEKSYLMINLKQESWFFRKCSHFTKTHVDFFGLNIKCAHFLHFLTKWTGSLNWYLFVL